MFEDSTMDEVITASGHEVVQATHASTLEVTTDEYLTPAGDCIVAIEADRSPREFDQAFVAACQDRSAHIELTIAADGHAQTVVGRGDPALTFDSDRAIVARTSDYVDDRTVLVEADAAAKDLDRELITAIQSGATVQATLSVSP